MAGKTAILAVRIVSDATDAAKGFDQSATAASRWERGLSVATKAAGVATAAIGALGKSAFDAASEQQQAFGAVESVYGRAAGQVQELAKAAGDAVGLSTAEYAQFAAVLGAQLSNLGVAQEDLIGTQDDLIGTAADLAATFGGTTADAVEALSALFRGETDPIEKYGVSIKAADVQARLASKGLDNLTGAARTQAETQARLELLTEQTAAAQGQFAREADTAAGAQQRASAAWKNAQASLGQALLPVVSRAATVFAGLSQWVQENTRTVQLAVTAIAALSAVVLTVSAVTKAWGAIMAIVRAATTAWTAVQWLLNAALTANPIGIVIVAVAALVAGIIVAYQKSETFRAIVQKAGQIAGRVFSAIADAVRVVIDWIKRAASFLGGPLSAAFRGIGSVARTVFGRVGDALSNVRQVAGRVGGAVKSGLSSAFQAASGAGRSALDRLRPAFDQVRAAGRRVDEMLGGPFSAAFRAARRIASAAINAIRNPIDTVRRAMDRLGDLARKVADWFRSIKMPRIRWPEPPGWLQDIGRGIGGIFSASAAGLTAPAGLSAMSAGTTALTTAAAGRRSGTRGGGLGETTFVQVNVNGALDPVATARQIQRVLHHQNVRVGMSFAAA